VSVHYQQALTELQPHVDKCPHDGDGLMVKAQTGTGGMKAAQDLLAKIGKL
jgi:hypothetical protein